MKMKSQIRRFVVIQIVIIATTLLVLLLGEYVHVSHRVVGTPLVPYNTGTVIWETFLFLVVISIEILISVRFLRRIIYLENFMLVCSSCSKVKIKDEWIPMTDYITMKTNVLFSHGLCPTCLVKFEAEI